MSALEATLHDIFGTLVLDFKSLGTATGGGGGDDTTTTSTKSSAAGATGAAGPVPAGSTRSATGKAGPKCTVAAGSPYAAYAGALCGRANRHFDASSLSYLLTVLLVGLLVH